MFYVISTFVVLALGFPAQAKLSVESAEIGVARLVRAGVWNRFSVTIRSEGAPFKGIAFASFGDETIARAVTIPANGSLRWEDAVRLSPLASAGEIRLRSDDEEERFEIPVTATTSEDDVAMLALARERGTIAFIADRSCADWMDSEKAPKGRFVVADTGTVRQLPSTWMGWNAVDVLVWNASAESLSWTEPQRRAFERWLFTGGTVVVVADERAATSLPTVVGPYLPVIPRRWETFALPAYVGATTRVRALIGSLRDDARSLLTVENRVLVAMRDVGLGRAFTVGVPSATTEVREGLWRIVCRAMRVSPLRTWEPRSTNERERLVDRLTVPHGATIRFPPRARVAALVGIALLVVLILLSVVARYLPLWATVFIVVGVLSTGLLSTAFRARTRLSPLREWGVLRVFPELGDGYWQGALTLDATSARSVRVLFSSSPYLDSLDSDANGVQYVGDAGGELRDATPSVAGPRHWSGRAFLPFTGILTAQLLPDGSVRLANRTTLDYERIGLVRGDETAFVDGLAAGTSADAQWERFDSRRRLWNAFSLPTPLFAYWGRENRLDALISDGSPYAVGWARNVSVLGVEGIESAGNVLLLVVPVDIKADGDRVGSSMETGTTE
jgi:hypothetical protein